jgi:two-component system, cell cycle response regulator
MLPQTCNEPRADLSQSRQLKLVSRKLKRTRVSNKILIIDDDPFVCLGMKLRLEANYYHPCFAHDAESALSAALIEMPDLIILDIGLPHRDGYFVMQSLNALPELAHIPVIILTARDGFTHERRCRDAGAERFFEKPVSNRCLLTAIRELVE